MSNYLVDKDTHTAKIDYMEYDLDGYEFRPKNQITQTYIKVKSVKIYKEDMISAVLTKKFERNFNRLGQIILNFLYQDDDDCNDSDFFILLDEVQRLRSIEQLHFLDNQIRQKIAMVNFRKNVRAAQEEYNYDYEEEYEERKGRSR